MLVRAFSTFIKLLPRASPCARFWDCSSEDKCGLIVVTHFRGRGPGDKMTSDGGECREENRRGRAVREGAWEEAACSPAGGLRGEHPRKMGAVERASAKAQRRDPLGG